MNFSCSLSVTDRFSLSIDGLCKAVAARIAFGLEGALILLIWTRIKRTETRVLALIAAIRAGRVRGGWVIGARAACSRGDAGVLPSRPRLPRRFAWLCGLVPYEAAGFAGQLRHVLAEPEMVELLSATPRMGQLLRPLCHMLGIEVALLSPVVARSAVVDDGPATSDVRALPAVVEFSPARVDPPIVADGADGNRGFFLPA